MLFGLRSVIHCEYSISTVRVTYAIDFELSQWVSECNLVKPVSDWRLRLKLD